MGVVDTVVVGDGGRWWEMVGGGFWMIHDEWWEMVGDGGRGILDAEQLYKMVLMFFFQKNEKLLFFNQCYKMVL